LIVEKERKKTQQCVLFSFATLRGQTALKVLYYLVLLFCEFLQIEEFIILNRNFSFMYLLRSFFSSSFFNNIFLLIFVRKLNTLFSYDANMQILE